jgi:hypothetical protein
MTQNTDGTVPFINRPVIVWTLETKSLLPPFTKEKEFPLFGKEGLGEIFGRICLLILS